MVFTIKLEENMHMKLYSYFILLLNNKEELSPFRKWSLRRRDSHATPRNILSTGPRPAEQEKRSRRMSLS